MDVTCERCDTEYEFDETLVSDRGTTVKCTNCGHLFKVFRPGSGPSGGEARAWTIRKRGSTQTETLSSLRELQRRITQGELSEEDEISRSGEAWKRLGDIAELATFFAAARAASSQAARTGPGGRPQPTMQGMNPPTPFSKAPSSPPPPMERDRTDTADYRDRQAAAAAQAAATRPASRPPAAQKSTLMGVQPDAMATAQGQKRTAAGIGAPVVPAMAGMAVSATAPTQRGMQTPPPPATPSWTPTQPDAIPPAAKVPREAWHENAPPRGGSIGTAPTAYDVGGVDRREAARESTERTRNDRGDGRARPGAPTRPGGSFEGEPPRGQPVRGLYVDEDDEPAAPRRRGGSKAPWMVLVVVLLLAGGGVALGWSRIAPLIGLGAPEDPAAPFLAAGDRSLARDDYEDAKDQYTKALAFDPRDPRALASLGRTHAAWAQALDFEADDKVAQGLRDNDQSSQGEANALRRAQRQHAEDAREHAEQALRFSQNDGMAEVVVADALRLGGDRAAARQHLERAQAMMREAPGELHLVAALMAMDDANGDVAAARPEAERAVQADGALHRARLLLARALLAQNDVASARAQVDAVNTAVPGHPLGQVMATAIQQGRAPAPPLVAVPDAGLPVVAQVLPTPTPTPVPTPPGTDTPPTTDTPPGSGGGGGGAARDPGGDSESIPAGRDYDYYVSRGDASQEGGNPGRARRYFEAALQVRPGGSEALTGLGLVLADGGNHSEAVRKFQQAATQGYANAYFNLGESLRALGRNREAIAAFESYIERRPSGQYVGAARRAIENLGGAGAQQGGGQETPPPQPPPQPPPTNDPPPTPPGELPAPRGTDPSNPPPSSDPPAIGTE